MNAEAKPFLPSFNLPITASPKPIPSDSDAICQRKQGQNQDHHDRRHRQRRRRPARANSRRGSNINNDGPCHDEKQCTRNNNSSTNIINKCSDEGGKKQQLTNHQKQHQQKQTRRSRRQRKSKKEVLQDNDVHSNKDRIDDEIIPPAVAASALEKQTSSHGGQHQSQSGTTTTTRRRRHTDKRRVRQHPTAAPSNTEEQPIHQNHNNTNHHQKEDGLNLNEECNFPTLATTTSVTNNNLGGADNTSWNNQCLARKLATSIELEHEEERKQKLQQQQQQMKEEQLASGSVQLTKLSSRSFAQYTISDGNKIMDEASSVGIVRGGEQEVDLPGDSSDAAVSSTTHTPSTSHHSIPNTKLKWTQSEVTKMRSRWWQSVRAKQCRKKAEEEKQKQEREDQKQRRVVLQNGNNNKEYMLQDDSTSSGDGSDYPSSSSSDDGDGEVDSLVHVMNHDPTQPPSLSNPFDEISTVNIKALPVAPSTTPLPSPHHPLRPSKSPQEVPELILDLERKCLQSSHPLHCAIYNHALMMSHPNTDRVAFNDSSYCGDDGNEKSDGEIVLHRLLTTQNSEDVMQWKCERIRLSELRGLETIAQYQESRVNELTDTTGDLLSADTNSLTPLQLAIYWNLPRTIRLLYATTTTTTTANPYHSATTARPSEASYRRYIGTLGATYEEDEFGRTPLMMACELGHVSCIQTILLVSSPRRKKLDRRERIGGNTAFHFCCMGRNYGKRVHGHLDENVASKEGEEEADDATDLGGTTKMPTALCAESIDILLQYTPSNVQKRVLMMTNCNGQNLLHLACSRGDLRLLLECLLGSRDNLPGLNPPASAFSWKISKALNVKDRFGYTPFLAAVAANSVDIVMHLLTARFATAGSTSYSSSSWFSTGCPLIVAVSKQSIPMVKLLLEMNGGMLEKDEVNRALLEVIYRMTEDEKKEEGSYSDDDTYEIICLLISHGGANPHLPVAIRFPGKPYTSGDKSSLISGFTVKMAVQEDTPLLAAVRAADAEAVRCMITAYSSFLASLKRLRRNDPLLRPQPESYFRRLEDQEDVAVYSYVDTALVTSLFLLWQSSQQGSSSARSSYGICALVLFKCGSRLNLSSSTTAAVSLRRLVSQQAMQWLEKCLEMGILLPPPKKLKSNIVEGRYYFQAPIAQYRIPNYCVGKKKLMINDVPFYHDEGATYMDWSDVLSELPWFRSRIKYGVNCNYWMQKNLLSNVSSCSKVKEGVTTYNNNITALVEDEFFLVVEGQKLLAHKSIVSARSGKLAAQIRFTESHITQQPSAGECLSVKVDHLPLLTAMMLLCHCYHGSIAFGLRKSPLEQCHQLLEMALVAEEYLCPSLLLECELRLLQNSSKNCCICPHCSDESILSEEQMDCPIGLECLEKAKMIHDPTLYCEPAGVHTYKSSSTFISDGGLITPESALDILAVAQQLEQSSSSSQQELYRIKFYQSGNKIDDPKKTMSSCVGWNNNINSDKEVGTGYISTPFAAAKIMAIWSMLRNFPAVIKSDSYLRQINNDDEDDIAEVDASFTAGAHPGNDECATLLLETCLEELARSPFNKK